MLGTITASIPEGAVNARIAGALAAAIAIAIPAEGLRQYAYRDPVGVPTICFGATRGVQMGDTATVAECRTMLNIDMLAAIDTVERCAPGLPTESLAAFADATYNLGPVFVCDLRNSTAARMLRAGDVVGACRQLPRWDKARVFGVMVALPGLTKRRADEMALCLAPFESAAEQRRLSWA